MPLNFSTPVPVSVARTTLQLLDARIARRIVPAGVPAQIAGHKQSAVAEGYNILTLDELRPYMAQIEHRFLELAGVQFDAKAEPGKLRVVAAA